MGWVGVRRQGRAGCTRKMASRSNSKKYGSRGGATGWSSGSCCSSTRMREMKTGSDKAWRDVRRPQDMGELVLPRQKPVSWGQTSATEHAQNTTHGTTG